MVGLLLDVLAATLTSPLCYLAGLASSVVWALGDELDSTCGTFSELLEVKPFCLEYVKPLGLGSLG